MRQWLFVLLAWLACVSQSPAIDAEAGKPYDFQVILRIAPHRLLTPTFRRQLRADLHDSLQAALGTLAQVQILDADARPSGDWLAPAALDAHTTLHPAKRHFVEVSYVGGQYVVQARQLDGSTGLASPITRQDRTADRAFVSRTVTRFIDQDFGAVGTVVGKDGDRVRLRFRGGAVPGADLARWAPVGSVFALVRIVGEPSQQRGRPEPAALLRAVAPPRDGECECRFFYRYSDQRLRDPLADWQHVSFRAVRLGTSAAPVRLRFVDGDDQPVADLQVRVGRNGFTEQPMDQGAVRGDGTYETGTAYEHLAFVRVSAGALPVARIPVAVLDDRVIVCKVDRKPHGEARQQVEIDARNLWQRLQDIVLRLTEQHRQLASLPKAVQYREALAKLTANLDALDTELNALTLELGRVRREGQQVAANLEPMLGQCDRYLEAIRKRRDTLLKARDDLEKTVQGEDSPEAREKREGYVALLQRAEVFCEDAEFEKVIETYEEVLRQFGERAEVRKRLEDLKKAWELKGDEHRKARTFAYGPWAGLKRYEDVRDNLPKARQAFEVCQRVGDRLTALKLFLVASTTATNLVFQRAEELGQSQSDEDRFNRKLVVETVVPELQALVKDLQTFVQPEGEKK